MAHADGMIVHWDVPIPMDDDTVLRADVFLPAEPGPHPVLLAHGPYGKGVAFYDGHFKGIWDKMVADHPETAARSSNRYQNWETVDPEAWTREGYACVRVDSRGAGTSPGVIDMLSPREIADYAACIEWAGTQPWSTGKVGLSGISYYAINQWLVASLQPPHLAAMFAFEGAADFYRDMSRHGGILTDFWRFLVPHQILAVQNGLGRHGLRNRVTGAPVSGAITLSDEERAANHRDIFLRQLAERLDGPFYRERSADWAKVQVPFLSSGSWGGQGLHLRGNTEAFTRAGSSQKYLEMHGLEHWTHFYTDYGFALQKRFFDHFLKGIDNGFDRDKPIRLQIRHPGNRFIERHETEWPIARTQWTRFGLDPQALRLHGDAANEPAAPSGSVSYRGLGVGVTFLTDPFVDETEFTGPAAAKLWIASTTTDADLFVIVRLFAPDMKEQTFIGSQDPLTPVALGWLRASHRKLDPALSTPERPYHAHDEVQPLVPGEIVECDIEIWPTSIVVPPGYRLGFSVRGTDYLSPFGKPRAAHAAGRPEPNGIGAMFHAVADRPPDVFGGTVTIHSGPGRESYLLLPAIPSPGST